MIVTRRIGIRIALIVIVAVILQVSFLSHLSILGATPNLIPVVVVALGLLGGGVVGAVCGFATGVVLDSVLLQPLGVSSLVLLSIGYLAGRYREGFEISNALIPLFLAGALTLLGGIGFSALQLLFGVETALSLGVLHEIVIQALLAILLAALIYPLLRRALRAALVEDAVPRRILIPGSVRRDRTGRRSRRAGRRRSSATARGMPRRVGVGGR
jgi:rod shape-determining protein MreD